MKVLISINDNLKDMLSGKLPSETYGSSLGLVEEFQKKGHDVTIVHPTQVDLRSDGVYFKNAVKFVNGKLKNGLFIRIISKSSHFYPS